MKKILAVFILTVMIITEGLPVFAANDDWWEDYMITNGEISDGILTLTGTQAAGAEAKKTGGLSTQMIFEAEIKVDSFGGDMGFCLYFGSQRAFFGLLPNTIRYRNTVGAVSAPVNIGTDWHTYTVFINGNSAELWVDGNFITAFEMQANKTAANVNFWAKSTGSTAGKMNIRNCWMNSVQTDNVVKREAIGLTAGAGNFGGWTMTDDCTVTDEGAVLAGKTLDQVTELTQYEIGISEQFEFAFRLKVNDFGARSRNESEIGARVWWNGNRIMVYFYENCLGYVAEGGNKLYIPVRIGYDWHDYRFVVNDNIAKVYMDDEYLFEYKLTEFTAAREILGFWVKKASQFDPEIIVENVSYTPITASVAVDQTCGGEYLEGTEIRLQADISGEIRPDSVDFMANGRKIGTAGAPNYTLNWTPNETGYYKVTANAANLFSMPAVDIEVRKKLGLDIVADDEICDSALTATASLFDNSSSVKAVNWYVDGEYFTKSTSSPYCITVPNAAVGVHTVYAEGVDKMSAVVASNKKEISVSATKNITLGNSYILNYRLTGGNAQINAGDGYYSLQITHENGALKYLSKDGEKTVDCASGEISLVVNSGYLKILKDGNLIANGFLPRGTSKGVTVNGSAVCDLKATANPDGRNLYYTKFCNKNLHREAYNLDLPSDYAVEFDLKCDNAERYQDEIVLNDGRYKLELNIKEGGIYAKTSPLGLISQTGEYEFTKLADIQCGENVFYRIEISKGIAQLFADNKFVVSFRMPQDGPLFHFKRSISEPWSAFFAIRSREESYSYSETFRDLSAWQGKNAALSDGKISIIETEGTDSATLLNTYTRYFEADSEILVNNTQSGFVGFVFGYIDEENYLYAGYNFATGKYEAYEKFGTDLLLVQNTGSLPIGERVSMKLIRSGSRFKLIVGDTEVLSCDHVKSTANGRIGYWVKNADITVSRFAYTGDAIVTAGLTDAVFKSGSSNSGETIEYEDGTIEVLPRGGNDKFVSTDRGHTWTMTPKTMSTHGNTIWLQSGKLLNIMREQVSDNPVGHAFKAYVSSDGGSTFDGPFTIETTSVDNRAVMNNKVSQAANGRIFWASTECGHAQENDGYTVIYYSDDDGYTWTKSENDITREETGFNAQEAKVVDLSDGTARVYFRSSHGFLAYCDSPDNGVTWDTNNIKLSGLIATMCAFNIERDPTTGNHYVTWEYNNTNDTPAMQQYPRFRGGLAVSRDDGKTWEYLADVASGDVSAYYPGWEIGRHFNYGIRAFSDCIIVNYADTLTTASANNGANLEHIVALDKDKLMPLARFPKPWLQDGTDLNIIEKSNIKRALAYSSKEGYAYLNGFWHKAKPVGKNGVIPAFLLAEYLDADYTVTEGAVTIDLSAASVTLNTEIFNQIPCVSAEEAAEKLGLSMKEQDGVIVFAYSGNLDAMLDCFKKVY